MVKKENVQSNSNSLLQTATNKRLGASRLALNALRSGARPPVKKVKVKSDASKVSELSGSVATPEVLPAVVHEVQLGDIDADSSVMGMSLMSSGSSGVSISGRGKSGNASIGKAVKTTPQPRSNEEYRKAEPRPLVKKSMDIQNGIKFTAPSPMTLDRVHVQRGQERSAPESEEYRLQQEKEREQEREELKRQKQEQKRLELRKQLELELGEGFEAQLDDMPMNKSANPVHAAAVKKKSLVKKILSKMKPKSPTKKQQRQQQPQHEGAKEKPTKPITAMEARSLARRALDASKQRRSVQQGDGGGGGNPLLPVSEILTEQKEDSISDLDSSVRRFPVNEILMNKHDDHGEYGGRDDDTVSTLGAPMTFDRFDRSRISESVPGQSVPFFMGGNHGGGLDPESGGGPLRKDIFHTEVLDGSNSQDGRVPHRLGSALVDQMDMTTGSDDTGAIEVIMGRCNPSSLVAQRDPNTGKLVVRSMDPIDYALAALCPNPQPSTKLLTDSSKPNKNQDSNNTGSEEEYDQENMKPRYNNPLSPVDEELRSPYSASQPLGLAVPEPDTRDPPTALSPSSKFTFAIDEAIRNVQTQLEKNQTSGEISLMQEIDDAPGGVLEAIDLVGAGNSSSSSFPGRNNLSPIVEVEETVSAGASPRSNRSNHPSSPTSPRSPLRSSNGGSDTEGDSFQDGPNSPKSMNSRRASTLQSDGSGTWNDGKDDDTGSVESDRYSVPDLEGGDAKQNTGKSSQKPTLGFMSTLAMIGSDLFGSTPKKQNSKAPKADNGAVIDLTDLDGVAQAGDGKAKEGSHRKERTARNGESDAGDIMAIAEMRLSGQVSPRTKSPRTEITPRLSTPSQKDNAFRFDDMMDIAETKLMSSNEKGFSDDELGDRYSVGEEAEVSPRPVIVGQAVESTACDASIPVVRGVEVKESRKKSSKEKTPKASGAGRAQQIVEVETVITVDDESQADIEVTFVPSFDSAKNGTPRGNEREYKVKKVSGKGAPLEKRRSHKQARGKNAGNGQDLALNAPAETSFEVYEDADGNEVLCYGVDDQHGRVHFESEVKKGNKKAKKKVAPKPDDANRRRTRKSTLGDQSPGKKAAFASTSPNSNRTAIAPNSPNERSFAGFFSDGLFDLLSAEESTAAKDVKGGSSDTRGRSTSTDADGGLTHDDGRQRLIRQTKRKGDPDVLDFVCEYSEHVVCGDQEKITNGSNYVKEVTSGPIMAGQSRDEDALLPSPISTRRSASLQSDTNELNLEDYMSDGASTMGSSLAHMTKDAPPNFMCGAVPLYLLYSMTQNDGDEDGEYQNKYGRSPRRGTPSPRRARKSPSPSPRRGRKSPQKSPRRRRDPKASYASGRKNQDPNQSEDEDSIEDNKPTSPTGSQPDTVKRATHKKEKRQPQSPKPESTQRRSSGKEMLPIKSSNPDRSQENYDKGNLDLQLEKEAELKPERSTPTKQAQTGTRDLQLERQAEFKPESSTPIKSDPTKQAQMGTGDSNPPGGESVPVLLDQDDSYWDTLSTIASTKDRSSDLSSMPQMRVRSKPGPIPDEITTKNKKGKDVDAEAAKEDLGKISKEPTGEITKTSEKVKSGIPEHREESSLVYSIETSDDLLPKNVGLEPGTGQEVVARASRFGSKAKSSDSKNSRVAGLIAKFEAVRTELDGASQSSLQRKASEPHQRNSMRGSERPGVNQISPSNAKNAFREQSFSSAENQRMPQRGVSWGYEEVFEPPEPPGCRTETTSPRQDDYYDENTNDVIRIESPRGQKSGDVYFDSSTPEVYSNIALGNLVNPVPSAGSEGYEPVPRAYSNRQNHGGVYRETSTPPTYGDVTAGNLVLPSAGKQAQIVTQGGDTMHSRGSEGYDPVLRSYSTPVTQVSTSPRDKLAQDEGDYPEQYVDDEYYRNNAQGGWNETIEAEEAYEEARGSREKPSGDRTENLTYLAPGMQNAQFVEEEDFSSPAKRELRETKGSGIENCILAEEAYHQTRGSHLVPGGEGTTHSNGSAGYEPIQRAYSQLPLSPAGRGGYTYAINHHQEETQIENCISAEDAYDETRGSRVAPVGEGTTHSNGSEGYEPIQRAYSQLPSSPAGRGVYKHAINHHQGKTQAASDMVENPTTHSNGSEGYEPVQRSYSAREVQRSTGGSHAEDDAGAVPFVHDVTQDARQMHVAQNMKSNIQKSVDWNEGHPDANHGRVENPTTHSNGSEGYEPIPRSYSTPGMRPPPGGGHVAQNMKSNIQKSVDWNEGHPDANHGRVENPTTHSNGSEGYEPIPRSYSTPGMRPPPGGGHVNRDHDQNPEGGPNVTRALPTSSQNFTSESENRTSHSTGSGGYEPARRAYSPNSMLEILPPQQNEDEKDGDGSSSGSEDSPYSLYEKLPGPLSKGSKGPGRQGGWGFEEPKSKPTAYSSGINGATGSPKKPIPINGNRRFDGLAIEPASSQSDYTESDGSQQEFERTTRQMKRGLGVSERPDISQKPLLQQTIDRSTEFAAAASKGFVAAAAAAMIAGDKLVNSDSNKGGFKNSKSQRIATKEMDESLWEPQEERNGIDLLGDGSKKDLTVEEEERLISRTLELSKAILSSVNAQGLNSMMSDDDEIVKSLISLETEDESTTARSSKLGQSTDTAPEQTSFAWPTVPVSVSFPGITLQQSIQALIRSDQIADQAASIGKESISTPSVSQVSVESPVDLNKLFSKYDNLAHQLIDQNGKLRKAAIDPSAKPQIEGSEHSIDVMKRLEELRRQRSKALTRFESPGTSARGTADEGRDQADPPARMDLSNQARVQSPEKAVGSRARDLLKKYYYGGDSIDSQESRLDRNADPPRPRSAGRQILPSNDPQRAKSAERLRSQEDFESVSTGSGSTKTTASRKARELRKQLDEALKASKAIRESQDNLGLELRTFKQRFYDRNNELEDKAFGAMEDANGL